MSTILSRFSTISIHNVGAIRGEYRNGFTRLVRSTDDIARKVEPNSLLFLPIVIDSVVNNVMILPVQNTV